MEHSIGGRWKDERSGQSPRSVVEPCIYICFFLIKNNAKKQSNRCGCGRKLSKWKDSFYDLPATLSFAVKLLITTGANDMAMQRDLTRGIPQCPQSYLFSIVAQPRSRHSPSSLVFYQRTNLVASSSFVVRLGTAFDTDFTWTLLYASLICATMLLVGAICDESVREPVLLGTYILADIVLFVPIRFGLYGGISLGVRRFDSKKDDL